MREFKGNVNGKEFTNFKEFMNAAFEAMDNRGTHMEISFTDKHVDDTKVNKPFVNLCEILPDNTNHVIPEYFIENVSKLSDENRERLIDEIKINMDEIEESQERLEFENKEHDRQIKRNEVEWKRLEKDQVYYEKLLRYLNEETKLEDLEDSDCEDDCEGVKPDYKINLDAKIVDETVNDKKKDISNVLNIFGEFAEYLQDIGFWDKNI